MTGKELEAAAVRLFGEIGWKTELAKAVGCDRATIRRWVKLGKADIPWMGALAVEAITARKIEELQNARTSQP